MLVYNILIGNADAHAKNYSVECPSAVYAEIMRVIDAQLVRLDVSGQVHVELNSSKRRIS